MANQELLDYIKGQLSLGVSRDAIRSALLGAGWQQTDIEGAFGAAQPGQSSAQPSAQPVMDVQHTVSTISQASPVVESKPQTISADFFQSKSAEVFSPTITASPKSEPKREPTVIQVSQPHPLKTIIMFSVLGIAVVSLGALYAMASVKIGNLQSQLDILTSGKADADAQLASLRRGTTDGDQQIKNLNTAINDLNAQFDFLIPGTSSVKFDLTGRLGTSTLGYWLKTSKGIYLNLKNAKDAKIEPSLRGFVGSDINIAGTHNQGSKDVTITSINGVDVASLVQAQPTGSSTPAAPAKSSSTTTAPKVTPPNSAPID